MNPWIIAAAAATISAFAFFGGYSYATDQYQENLIAAQATALKAQEDLNKETRAKADALSALAAERRTKSAALIAGITAKLDALPMPVVVNEAGVCEITPEAIQLLNEASDAP